jgi:phosphoglycolate phosphatase-like HAD superfamily hydrolase
MVLVIFDVDGTLVYSDKKDSLTFAQAYEDLYGHPFPSIDWRNYPHVTDTVIFDTVLQQHFGRRAEAGEVERFQAHYIGLLRDKRHHSPEDYQAIPGARQAVGQLAEQEGYLVGVATGGWRQPAEVKLEHVGIRIAPRLFSGADGKAEREAILEEVIARARESHGSALRKIVYVGDAEWDVRTTRNLQLAFIGLRRLGDCEMLHREGARHVIQDFTDFDRFRQLLEEACPPDH